MISSIVLISLLSLTIIFYVSTIIKECGSYHLYRICSAYNKLQVKGMEWKMILSFYLFSFLITVIEFRFWFRFVVLSWIGWPNTILFSLELLCTLMISYNLLHMIDHPTISFLDHQLSVRLCSFWIYCLALGCGSIVYAVLIGLFLIQILCIKFWDKKKKNITEVCDILIFIAWILFLSYHYACKGLWLSYNRILSVILRYF